MLNVLFDLVYPNIFTSTRNIKIINGIFYILFSRVKFLKSIMYLLFIAYLNWVFSSEILDRYLDFIKIDNCKVDLYI